MKLVRSSVMVAVPSTVSEWELYSDMPGVGAAAKRLTAALVRAANPNITDQQAFAIVRKALDLEVEYGATDTESRSHAREALSELRGGKALLW